MTESRPMVPAGAIGPAPTDSDQFTVRLWRMGQPEPVAATDHGATVEVVCPNGDVAQLVVTGDGEILVRAWRAADLYANGGENRSIFSTAGRFHA